MSTTASGERRKPSHPELEKAGIDLARALIEARREARELLGIFERLQGAGATLSAAGLSGRISFDDDPVLEAAWATFNQGDLLPPVARPRAAA